jgi:peptidoglycan/LPS O-acetylase OafA/YrhL
MVMQQKRLKVILVSIVLLLCIPLIAMVFTDEVKWSLADFIVAAVLLFGTGLLCELTLRKVRSKKQRIILCIIILSILLLTWAELAVGIFGTRFSGS